ncbi:MAG: HDOD domain-containing protein [Gammaproteobacteria bacterium]|nr:HDOD domain-containing protein [Gammaproteobacteria bacterium]
MRDIFIGRQAIYDSELKVYAYELLFRSSKTNNASGITNGDQATSTVISNAFMEIGLEDLVGSRLAFINLTSNFFLSDEKPPFSPEHVVLEVLENIKPDADIIEGIQHLSKQGYAIALDDFVYDESLIPLVELADIIKLDMRALGHDGIVEQMEILKPYPVKLVAEKIENQDEFDFCKELGFDYFQGYFLCQPRVVKKRSLSPNRIAILQLLAEISQPDVDVKKLEALITQDVTLSYKLLRYINSAFYSLPKKVESIQQGLVYLGLKTIKMWAYLLSMANIDDKPNELMVTAITRGKMCELLAGHLGVRNSDTFFTVGIFSTLDAMMDMPMNEILNSLPLSTDIQDALLHHEGPAGEILKQVIAYEQGLWSKVNNKGISTDQFTSAYLGALSWADETCKQIN